MEEDDELEKADQGFDFDHFLHSKLCEFGRYQQFIVIMLCLPACFLSAYNSLDMAFLAYTPKHRCNVALVDEISNLSVIADQCKYRNGTLLTEASNVSLPKCDHWTYDTEYFESTIVTQWDLVCDKALILRSMISFMNIASLFSMVLSLVQDRFGRKKAFVFNLSLFLFGNCGSLLAPNLYVFAFFKFIGGISCMWNICFSWALEFVGPNKRSLVTTCVIIVYSIATMSLALLGYLCNTWIQLGLCTSVPFVGLFSFIFFIPESPRWLLSQGRVDEALEIIHSIARWEKINLDLVRLRYEIVNHSTTIVDFNENKITKRNFVKFLRSWNLMLKTALLTIASAAGMQLYDAVPFYMERLNGNFFLSFAFQAGVEAPAGLCALLLMNRAGRVLSLCLTMFLGGVACLLTWPADLFSHWGGVLMSTTARFFICVAMPISYQFSNELYPTVTRGVGTNTIIVGTSLFSICAQYVLHSSSIWTPLPMFIMGPLAMLGAVISLFLPETKNVSLPDTIEQCEMQSAAGFSSFRSNISCAGFSRGKDSNESKTTFDTYVSGSNEYES